MQVNIREPFITALHTKWLVGVEWASRIRNPLRRLHDSFTADASVRAAVRTLRRDGVVILPAHISGSQLTQAQAEFARMVEFVRHAPEPPRRTGQPPRSHVTYQDYKVYDAEGVVESLNPFVHGAELLRAALDPFVLDVVSCYWGRRLMLSQASAMEYAPSPLLDVGSFGWHHDSLGKRTSAMLLLTDVADDDQHMIYVKGSQHLLHSRLDSHRNWTEQDVCEAGPFERLACTGPAGTVVIFDANGLHRGKRSMGRVRRALVSSFCYGYYVWPFTIASASMAALSDRQRQFLRRNPKITIVDDPIASVAGSAAVVS